jgi:hypothetical protein
MYNSQLLVYLLVQNNVMKNFTNEYLKWEKKLQNFKTDKNHKATKSRKVAIKVPDESL